jgi:hypothetical protein
MWKSLIYIKRIKKKGVKGVILGQKWLKITLLGWTKIWKTRAGRGREGEFEMVLSTFVLKTCFFFSVVDFEQLYHHKFYLSMSIINELMFI